MKTLRTYLGVVLILIIALCALLITQKLFRGAKLDLTEEKLYTLSSGTRNIIQELNRPIELKLYYARSAAMGGPEQIRHYNNYFRYVRDLLREYERRSNDMIELSVVDPRPYSDAEQEAVEAGLEGIPLSSEETFYFGLVARTELGKEATIPFFQPDREQFVEYEVSRLMTQLMETHRQRIGVLSSLPVTGEDISPYMRQMMQMQGRDSPEAWTVFKKLREGHEIVDVDENTDRIDEDLDLLILVHPGDLSPRTLFAIDQYVMRGGKLLAFVDPHCVNDRPEQGEQKPMAGANQDSSSSLNQLTDRWGVRMKDTAIAADMDLAIKTRLRQNAPAQRIPIYLQLGAENMNRDEIVTGQLDSVRVLFAGILESTDGDADVTPLIQTTEDGQYWEPRSPQELQMLDPRRIRAELSGERKRYMLGARLTGPFTTNYPDGPPPPEEDGDDENTHGQTTPDSDDDVEVIQKSDEEAAVMVFSDVDLISDILAYQDSFTGGGTESGDNAALAMNSVEFLSGSRNLIDIRSRGRFRRPFTVIEEIEAQTEEATAEQIDELNRRIQQYQQELWQLQDSDTEEGLVESNTVQEKRELQNDIREARQKLRRLRAGQREKIESLKARLQFHNLFWAPLAVLCIAIGLSIIRYLKARQYAAQRRN